VITLLIASETPYDEGEIVLEVYAVFNRMGIVLAAANPFTMGIFTYFGAQLSYDAIGTGGTG